MIHVDFPNITTDNLHYEPFFHIEVPYGIVRETNDQLHDYYLNNATWEQEETSDGEHSSLQNVQWGKEIDYAEWDKFRQRPWLEQLFDVYKLKLPQEFYTAICTAKHGKGTSLVPHTDGPPDSSSWTLAERKFKEDLTGIITQHIYILDTDKYPESGMQLYYSDFDATDPANLRPVKQIKALPGTYLSYRNTPNSFHGVPEQTHDFNRMLVTIKTFW